MCEVLNTILLFGLILLFLFISRPITFRSKLLDDLPLTIFITSKKFHLKYSNIRIDTLNVIDYDEHRKYCHVEINGKLRTCSVFTDDLDICFVVQEKDVNSVLNLFSVSEVPEYFKSEIKVQSILEYTSKLLNAECAIYYNRKDNQLIEQNEFWSDKHLADDIQIVTLLNLDYTKPYLYILPKDLNKDRKQAWENIGIKAKLVVPIWYNNSMKSQVVYTFTHDELPNESDVQLVTGILNSIVNVKIKFESEKERQSRMNEVRKELLHYFHNENLRLDAINHNIDTALENARMIEKEKR